MSPKKELQNILVIILGFSILYALFRWWGFLAIAGGLGIPGLLSPFLRRYIVKGWHKLATILGFINSRIILSAIFFLILTPLALLSRLFSKDKMQLKKKASDEATYFHHRDHDYAPKDFEQPW